MPGIRVNNHGGEVRQKPPDSLDINAAYNNSGTEYPVSQPMFLLSNQIALSLIKFNYLLLIFLRGGG